MSTEIKYYLCKATTGANCYKTNTKNIFQDFSVEEAIVVLNTPSNLCPLPKTSTKVTFAQILFNYMLHKKLIYSVLRHWESKSYSSFSKSLRSWGSKLHNTCDFLYLFIFFLVCILFCVHGSPYMVLWRKTRLGHHSLICPVFSPVVTGPSACLLYIHLFIIWGHQRWVFPMLTVESLLGGS